MSFRRLSIPLVTLATTASVAAGGEPARRIDPPAAAGAFAPHLALAGDAVLLSWLEPGDGGTDQAPVHRLRVARLAGGAWSEPATVVERDDLFANWADVPSVTAVPSGVLLAHWLQKSGGGTFEYDVMLARSADGGATWAPLGTPHRDGTRSEHGFVSTVAHGEDLRAFWLDGRHMADGAPSDPDAAFPGAMTLRTTLVGAAIAPSERLDPCVCECCNTAAALTAAGPIVAYRDRSPEEIRDVAVVRWTGTGWSTPRLVHEDGWAIPGCPVNGPAIDARGDDVIVAWYTGAVPYGAVRAAFSRDGGATFAPPVTIDDRLPVGRAKVVLEPDGHAVVGWLAQRDGRGIVTVRRLAPDGGLGAPVELARTSRLRASGFPCMVRRGGTLVVAWTHVDGEKRTSVRALVLGLDTLPAPGEPTPAPPPTGLDPDG
ncbi:MAG: hypothetical protein ACYTJ0_16245 [Planctomycetota bacterium]|jgi:hypothetical protein